MIARAWLRIVVLLVACGPKPGPDDQPLTTDTTAANPGTTTTPTSSSTTDTTSTSTTTTTSTTTSTSTSTSTGEPPQVIECQGKIYPCGDGLDNDGDGLVDLADPECASPCDADEASFQNDILPGNGDPCRVDCYFDTNPGNGDDGCMANLYCDPRAPLGPQCPFTPECLGGVSETPPECLDFCSPLTPNGCDCFGCCHLQTPDGPIDIFLEGSPDCRLGNLGACTSCTFNAACANPCEPAACELCLGDLAPPPGCAAPGCQGGVPCSIDSHGVSTCAAGSYCITGCCAQI